MRSKVGTLTTLREKLIKIDPRIVHYGRYAVFQPAELAMERRSQRCCTASIIRQGVSVPGGPQRRAKTALTTPMGFLG